jgi:hypothetical protein
MVKSMHARGSFDNIFQNVRNDVNVIDIIVYFDRLG